MKKLTLFGAVASFILGTTSYAQVTTAGNNSIVPPQFVGFNGTGPVKDLQIRNDFNRPITMHTNSIQRAIFRQGNAGSAAGRVAFGNNLPVGFTPLSRLHLHQTAAVNTVRFTTDNMAGGVGFEVGYDATSNVQNQQYAEIHNRENTAIKFFTTGNTQRMHINQSRQSQINGYSVGTPGYVGIGENVSNLWGNTNSLGIGPFSLLHLNNERGNTSAEQVAYRPWMRGGITFTDNTDLAYVGYRSFTDDNTATGNIVSNRNEFAMVWTNNPFGSTGPDDMCFRFVGSNGNVGPPVPGALPNTIDAINLTSISDLDGLHIARFTAAGNMGLGPTFGEDHPIYVRPQSLLHMSRDQQKDTWLQVTNQTGTGQTVNDGLRIGITTTGTAHIRQQENLPMIFYTNSIETARMIPNTASTLTGNPTMVGIGNFATNPNPIDAKLDIDGDLRIRTVTQRDTLTRVLVIDSADHNRVHWRSIASLVGNVTANNGVSVDATTGAVQLGVPCQDSLGNNNLPEILANAFTEDRVVAIGDFNLWFATYAGDKGGVGIGGQPASTPFCGTGNTLEISANGASKYGAASSSGLRFNHLTSDSLTVPVGTNGVVNTKVLTVDNDGDVVLVNALVGGGGSVTADNGLSINPANNVQLGQLFTGTPIFTGVASLLNDREVPLDGFNLHFTGLGTQGVNQVSIGTPSPLPLLTGDANLTSKFSTYNEDDLIAGSFVSDEQNFSGSSFGFISNGQYVRTNMIGVSGIAIRRNSDFAVGVYGSAAQPNPLGGGGAILRGVVGQVRVGSSITGARAIGVHGIGENLNGGSNYGGYFEALNSPSVNYGIWASAPVVGTNRAAYFNGTIEIAGGPIFTSDKMFKINVANIEKATDVLRKLKPHTYNMDVTNFPQFNFESRLQYGFIAQEVGDVLPNLVHDSYMPSELDSLGNEIRPAVNYKSLNYNAFIPITVQAVNELNARLDNSTLSDQNVKTNVQNLANSLDKVKQMRGVTYEWSSAAQNDMNLDSLQHIGFIAQEIAAIEPLLTFTDDSSLVHVNYDRVAPLLVESVKELDDKILAKDSIINHLQDEINTIKECLRTANICYGESNRTINTEPSNAANYKSVELTNVNSIILDQNLPNPFAENTVINYNIPMEVAVAKLLFYDLNGRIIKELIIEERGESKLTVYGVNLKTGVYTYSLIADGELIATKKMVKK